MLKKSERDIRQELHDDPRSIDSQLQEFYYDKNSPWHAAYLNPEDPQHEEAIQRVSILAEAKFDNQPYAPEVMPVVNSTGTPNAEQLKTIV
jgi:hypothetical protein